MEPTIHHITDLHVGPLHASARRPSFLARDKDKVQSDEIARYLRYLAHHKDKLPDFVVISGDLTSYASESEFGRIADFLDDLGKILNRDDEPDVNWPPKNGRHAVCNVDLVEDV
jgi:3',5'-cyclic AMP phosphodiesterase CpdA